MRIKKILSSIVFLFFVSGIFSQENPIIAFFKGQVFNDNVLLTWNIVDGNNCNGIIIYHSLDGQSFSEVGSIPGLCGAVDENEPYQFIHENPEANQHNFYRLGLGGQGFTSIIDITFYKTGESGFIFFPNPSTEYIELFINDNYRDASIEIIDSNGKRIMEEKIPSGSLIQIPTITLNAGIYILRMRNGNELISSERLVKL